MKHMSEKTAIIFIGIQASGKSTFYHERFEDYVHINLDTLHTRNKEKLLLQECMEKGTLLWWITQTRRGRTERSTFGLQGIMAIASTVITFSPPFPIALREIKNGKGKQGYRIRPWQVRIANWNFRNTGRVSTSYSMSV